MILGFDRGEARLRIEVILSFDRGGARLRIEVILGFDQSLFGPFDQSQAFMYMCLGMHRLRRASADQGAQGDHRHPRHRVGEGECAREPAAAAWELPPIITINLNNYLELTAIPRFASFKALELPPAVLDTSARSARGGSARTCSRPRWFGSASASHELGGGGSSSFLQRLEKCTRWVAGCKNPPAEPILALRGSAAARERGSAVEGQVRR